MKRLHTPFLLLFLLSVLLAPSHAITAESHKKSLRLGVLPYKAPRVILETFAPIASLLTRELKTPVRVITAPDFDEFMNRVSERNYDIIFLGYPYYLKAHDTAGYVAIIRGHPSFHGGILVRKDSGIKELSELKWKKIAAVSPETKAGFQLQKKELEKHGIDTGKEIKFNFVGRADSVVYAVLNRKSDAGATRLDTLNNKEFANWEETLDILFTTPEITQFPFAVHPDMGPHLRQDITKALASITGYTPEGAAILKNLSIKGFKKVTHEVFERLRTPETRNSSTTVNSD
ncbi:MAG: phosphate/phosphite/phosphonate ABC transporter substrate-binding protein [Desulfobulbaceae bacterium]|nr:phosphate/phosphite/phosphonate ABC transporter substrate-binding protein [Desulfobulbaceae bacterium]MCK5341134.1 phosphate/phosphite/phosphonate ABC transporter substrate-binding protein [Desulfobulbaceae bacterium]MCK5403608.1 phosphate/phosphite/phosphonate ABC transporter substrate-binding protein [Desulfobulbaceae bacterium]